MNKHTNLSRRRFFLSSQNSLKQEGGMSGIQKNGGGEVVVGVWEMEQENEIKKWKLPPHTLTTKGIKDYW